MKFLDLSILDRLDVCFWYCKVNEFSVINKIEVGVVFVGE